MNVKKYAVEFIGTFALIFMGAGAGAQNAGLVAVALAHGLTIVAMAYAFGSISGTHINPAVTFGLALGKHLSWKDAAGYWAAQLAGAAAGAWLLTIFVGDISAGATTFSGNAISALLLEALLTFFLVNAVFQTAVRGKGGEFAGLVIGLTLTGLILVGGPITGASLNPARTFGPALFTGTLPMLWVYVAGPLLGATAAWALDRTLNG
jgi:MIP family channel proteins